MKISSKLINGATFAISKKVIEIIKEKPQELFTKIRMALQEYVDNKSSAAKYTLLRLIKLDFKDFILHCIDKSIAKSWTYYLATKIIKKDFSRSIIDNITDKSIDGVVENNLISNLLNVIDKAEKTGKKSTKEQALEFQHGYKALFRYLNDKTGSKNESERIKESIKRDDRGNRRL